MGKNSLTGIVYIQQNKYKCLIFTIGQVNIEQMPFKMYMYICINIFVYQIHKDKGIMVIHICNNITYIIGLNTWVRRSH